MLKTDFWDKFGINSSPKSRSRSVETISTEILPETGTERREIKFTNFCADSPTLNRSIRFVNRKKRHSWCCQQHWTRQEENCHCHGRRLRFETPRTYSVRFRRLNISVSICLNTNGPFQGHHIWKKESCLMSFYTKLRK